MGFEPPPSAQQAGILTTRPLSCLKTQFGKHVIITALIKKMSGLKLYLHFCPRGKCCILLTGNIGITDGLLDEPATMRCYEDVGIGFKNDL